MPGDHSICLLTDFSVYESQSLDANRSGLGALVTALFSFQDHSNSLLFDEVTTE